MSKTADFLLREHQGHVLMNAQDFVERVGDGAWFREQYTLLREDHGVMDSLREALEVQGLWDAFLKYMETPSDDRAAYELDMERQSLDPSFPLDSVNLELAEVAAQLQDSVVELQHQDYLDEMEHLNQMYQYEAERRGYSL